MLHIFLKTVFPFAKIQQVDKDYIFLFCEISFKTLIHITPVSNTDSSSNISFA